MRLRGAIIALLLTGFPIVAPAEPQRLLEVGPVAPSYPRVVGTIAYPGVDEVVGELVAWDDRVLTSISASEATIKRGAAAADAIMKDVDLNKPAGAKYPHLSEPAVADFWETLHAVDRELTAAIPANFALCTGAPPPRELQVDCSSLALNAFDIPLAISNPTTSELRLDVELGDLWMDSTATTVLTVWPAPGQCILVPPGQTYDGTLAVRMVPDGGYGVQDVHLSLSGEDVQESATLILIISGPYEMEMHRSISEKFDGPREKLQRHPWDARRLSDALAAACLSLDRSNSTIWGEVDPESKGEAGEFFWQLRRKEQLLLRITSHEKFKLRARNYTALESFRIHADAASKVIERLYPERFPRCGQEDDYYPVSVSDQENDWKPEECQ